MMGSVSEDKEEMSVLPLCHVRSQQGAESPRGPLQNPAWWHPPLPNCKK